MSIRLSEILSGERAITATWGHFTVEVTYRLSERTPESQRVDTKDNPWIVRVLSAWDITDDEGVPLPIDSEHLEQVPQPILNAISRAVWTDDGLGEVESSSDAG